jgi:hypothetical protein
MVEANRSNQRHSQKLCLSIRTAISVFCSHSTITSHVAQWVAELIPPSSRATKRGNIEVKTRLVLALVQKIRVTDA